MHHAEGYVDRLEVYRPTTWAQNTYNYYRRDHLGNNCAVWDATNDTTLQQTVYYASGLPLSVSSGQSTQPYKYNGKEFIEMHGLDVTDLGFRSVHNARGRFDNMDPLCELAYHSSPYAISANNPVNNIDVLGLTPMGSWEQRQLNYTEVDKNGKITKHEENGDYRIYEVDEKGRKTCIGVEMPNMKYVVDDYLVSGKYIKTGTTSVSREAAYTIYNSTKSIYSNENVQDNLLYLLSLITTIKGEQYPILRVGNVVFTALDLYSWYSKGYKKEGLTTETVYELVKIIISSSGIYGATATMGIDLYVKAGKWLMDRTWEIESQTNSYDKFVNSTKYYWGY